jgi:hypothetical protein
MQAPAAESAAWPARFCCNFGQKIFDSVYPLLDLENALLNGREAAV